MELLSEIYPEAKITFELNTYKIFLNEQQIFILEVNSDNIIIKDVATQPKINMTIYLYKVIIFARKLGIKKVSVSGDERSRWYLEILYLVKKQHQNTKQR